MKRAVPAFVLALAGFGLLSAPAVAAPTAPDGKSTDSFSVGPQAKAQIDENAPKVPSEPAKGATKRAKVDQKTGAPTEFSIAADASVSFQPFLDYCSSQLSYTPVKNSSAVTKYVQVDVYNQGSTRTYYSTIAAGGTAYPYFYGVIGAYSAYTYVWNGSSYVYDEYKAGNNNCNVSASAVCSGTYPGWVQVTLKNNGTAYASVRTQKLQPTPQAAYYDYPVAGGAALTRWVYSGNKNYAIVTDTQGSNLTPYFAAGYC